MGYMIFNFDPTSASEEEIRAEMKILKRLSRSIKGPEGRQCLNAARRLQTILNEREEGKVLCDE